MTNYSEYFHPELEAVLEDIAKDPKAKLLRVPSSGQLVRAARNVRVGVAAPGLSTAEVELLAVHRETMGELLKQRCLIEFFAQPDADVRWHRSVTVDRRLEVRDEADWTAEARDVVALPVEDERGVLAKDVLAQCITGDPHRRVSIAQLAKTLLRVDPMDQAHVYLALDCYGKKRFAEASDAVEVLRGRTSSMLASYSEELAGSIAYARGDSRLALEKLQASHDLMPERPTAMSSALSIAVFSSVAAAARRAADALDDLVDAAHPAIADHCASIRHEIRAGELNLDTEGQSTALGILKDREGTASGSVIDACLS